MPSGEATYTALSRSCRAGLATVSPELRPALADWLRRKRAWCGLEPAGYVRVCWRVEGSQKLTHVRVHRLVIELVAGVRVPAELDVHHRDGNRRNNTTENLALVTRQVHAMEHGGGRPLVVHCRVCGRPFLRDRFAQSKGVCCCSRRCGSVLGSAHRYGYELPEPRKIPI